EEGPFALPYRQTRTASFQRGFRYESKTPDDPETDQAQFQAETFHQSNRPLQTRVASSESRKQK
ncbi:MAG: hypothetical protein ACQKBT_02225, partial [Puniceicoccales bacterium]